MTTLSFFKWKMTSTKQHIEDNLNFWLQKKDNFTKLKNGRRPLNLYALFIHMTCNMTNTTPKNMFAQSKKSTLIGCDIILNLPSLKIYLLSN
jgi:hypothetical protein